MKVMRIDPETGVSILEVSDSQLVEFLGENYRAETSEDGLIEYLFHELWKVAELEINNFVTMETKVVIGGLVIARPNAGSDFPEGFMSSENIDSIESTNKDSALGSRIFEHYKKNQNQSKFEFDSSDRAIYNGSFFPAIVIGPERDSQTFDNCNSRFRVWLFMKGVNDPSLVNCNEYSLAYLMEMMIEADDLTAAGNPPEFIRHILAKFRNEKS
jgi:hypothetical protein